MTAQPQGSVSFDQLADCYDATRTRPKRVEKQQAKTIFAELRAVGARRMLELGIGTGRVSRPLMQRGVRVTGVDIAPKMLGRLRVQLTPEHAPPDLLLADATRLPFSDGSFPAIVMAHVFHLVSDVDQALDEVRRVLAPDGVFLHDRTQYSEANPWHASYTAREELMVSVGGAIRHRPTPSEIERALMARGGSLGLVRYASSAQQGLAESLMNNARSNQFSWSWGVAEDTFQAFLEKYDRWCREYYGDREHEITHEMEVWTFA